MATASKQCSEASCGGKKATCTCSGCLKPFCSDDFIKHRHILRDKIYHSYNSLRQRLDDRENSLMEEIKQWEDDLIKKIQQRAEQCRQQLNQSLVEIKNQLRHVSEKLKQQQKAEEIDEIQLNEIKEHLNKLQEKTNEITNDLMKQKSIPLTMEPSVPITSRKDMTWNSNGITVAGGNGQENQLNQLSEPHCMCIDDDHETIYVADYGNDRIVAWKFNAIRGQIITHGNGRKNLTHDLKGLSDIVIDKKTNTFIIADPGNRRVIQLSRDSNTINEKTIISNIDCWGLGIDKDGALYTCDVGKNEVKRWQIGETVEGTLVAGGHGEGNQLNQLYWPTCVFIDDDYSVYIADCYNNRIMKWNKNAQEGVVVAGGNGYGDSLKQLHKPEGVVVDDFGRIYVADTHNQRVIRWCYEKEEGEIIVGTNKKGRYANSFQGPTRLYFDRQENLYVVDKLNHRIQKFERTQ